MNTRIRLVVSDLDGTLLDNNSTIPAANRQAVEDLRAAGIRFTIATGRMEPMAGEYVRQLAIEEPVITFNGGMVRRPGSSRVITQKNIPPQTAAAIYSYCSRNRLDFIAYTADTAFYPEHSVRIEFFEAYNQYAVQGGSEPVRLVLADRLMDANGLPRDPVMKFFLMSPDPTVLDEMEAFVAGFPELYSVCSVENGLDIMLAGVSKGDGLCRLAAYYGYSTEEVAAFGDQDNDAPCCRR